MKWNEYMARLNEALEAGRISEDAYNAAVDNASIFCDDEDEDDWPDNLPETYAEIEYDDFDDPEAILGARFDDLNYMRYMER